MSNYQEFDALPESWSHGQFIEGQPVDPSLYKWSGKNQPPAIGAEVKVYMNGLGSGIVKRYFAEAGWLGVKIELQSPPDWWLKQNAKDPKRLAHIFGMELEPFKAVQG
jgi:hypothetical protein